MRLTVLGKSPSWQDADGACSGYLVEDGDSCALVDCGNGVFSKLRRFRDYATVDAVVVSHLHADHFLDLVPYSYALTYAPRRPPVPIQRWPGVQTTRGAAAAPRTHGHPRPSDSARGRRARARGRRQAGRADPHLGRAGRALGAPRG